MKKVGHFLRWAPLSGCWLRFLPGLHTVCGAKFLGHTKCRPHHNRPQPTPLLCSSLYRARERATMIWRGSGGRTKIWERGIHINRPQTRGEERRPAATIRKNGSCRQEWQATATLNKRWEPDNQPKNKRSAPRGSGGMRGSGRATNQRTRGSWWAARGSKEARGNRATRGRGQEGHCERWWHNKRQARSNNQPENKRGMARGRCD